MDLLRLALKLDPKKTSKLLFKILNYDQEISKNCKTISKNK